MRNEANTFCTGLVFIVVLFVHYLCCLLHLQSSLTSLCFHDAFERWEASPSVSNNIFWATLTPVLTDVSTGTSLPITLQSGMMTQEIMSGVGHIQRNAFAVFIVQTGRSYTFSVLHYNQNGYTQSFGGVVARVRMVTDPSFINDLGTRVSKLEVNTISLNSTIMQLRSDNSSLQSRVLALEAPPIVHIAGPSSDFMVPLSTPWTPFSSTDYTPNFAKKNGIVYLSGRVKGFTSCTSGLLSLIFVLPSGYRPLISTRDFWYISDIGGDLIIDTLGNVDYKCPGGTSPTWVSLDGIQFVAA